MIKLLSQKFHEFLTCSNFLTTKYLPSCNIEYFQWFCHNKRKLLVYSRVKLYFSWIFSLECWTNFSKNWSSFSHFASLWVQIRRIVENYSALLQKKLNVYNFLTDFVLNSDITTRREIQIVATSSADFRIFLGKFLNFNDFILTHINSILSLIWKKSY